MTPFVTALIGPITDLISEFITDKDKAAELAYKIATRAEENAHAVQMGQLRVNEVQAAHKSMFVAGSRPAILWICAMALGYNTLAHPILDIWYEMPEVNTELLYPVMMGLLGLGAFRSFEKTKGVAREK